MSTHQLTAPPAPTNRSLDAAATYIAASGFADSDVGPVGLELEFHLYDRADVTRRVSWPELTELAESPPTLPARSRFTIEPGGQVELSTPVQADVTAGLAALHSDKAALVKWLAERGFGVAAVGADPVRPAQRVNPASRYVAMEQHFDALGCGPSGRAMMTATAALQLNLEVGPARGWATRVAHIHAVLPMLVAISANSPRLGSRASGWRSMRQQAWLGIDAARSGAFLKRPVPSADCEWARYALAAPVMLVRDHTTGASSAVLRPVAFGDWWAGRADLGRPATVDDLDYHLTTLFPPVRPRGYLEVRPLDAVGDPWLPGLVAIAVTLLDHPDAAAEAAGVCASLGEAWSRAAQFGLADRQIAAAAMSCLAIAACYGPPDLAVDIDRYAELVASGRTPGDLLADRLRRDAVDAIFEEQEDA